MAQKIHEKRLTPKDIVNRDRLMTQIGIAGLLCLNEIMDTLAEQTGKHIEGAEIL